MVPVSIRLLIPCALFAVGTSLIPDAQAQETAHPALGATDIHQDSNRQTPTLQTIRVTPEPLNSVMEVNVGAFGARDSMEVPLSIQSYDSQLIRESSSRTTMDTLAIDSSLSSASLGGSFDSFRLRGFKMDNFHSIRREGIAVLPYHDEGLENIERIDVLKGPSGFLYGFNSPGGTLNYILKRPTRHALTQLTAQASSLKGRYLAIDTSRTLPDGRSGWRLNAAYDKVGNFDHAGDLERKFASLNTDFRLSSRALLQLNADWYSKRVAADPLLRADQHDRANPLDPSSFVLPPRIDRRHLLSPSWWRYQTRTGNIDAKLEYRINPAWVSVTQLAYSRMDGGEIFTDYFDIQPDGTIGRADLYAFREERFSNRAFQTHLAGKFRLGRFHHDLFMGASARELRGETPESDFIESGEDISAGRISVGNVLSPVDPPLWTFGPRNPIAFRMNIRERSVFVSDLIMLGENLEVLLGGRYIWYRASDLQQGARPQRKNVFVPAGALIYRPATNLMSYISYARGFEAGEYAPYNASNANQPTDAIESAQVEVGMKTDISPHLNVGIALFDIRRDAAYLNTENEFVSDGQYRHRGVELNTGIRQGERLKLFGNLAFLDTTLKHVSDPATLNKRSEGVPRWKGSVGGRYTFHANPEFSVDTTISYVGRRPVDAQNSGFIPTYLLWDAGLNLKTRLFDQNATLRLHGKNLTDRYYYRGVNYLGGLEIGRGREVFLSMTLQF